LDGMNSWGQFSLEIGQSNKSDTVSDIIKVCQQMMKQLSPKRHSSDISSLISQRMGKGISGELSDLQIRLSQVLETPFVREGGDAGATDVGVVAGNYTLKRVQDCFQLVTHLSVFRPLLMSMGQLKKEFESTYGGELTMDDWLKLFKMEAAQESEPYYFTIYALYYALVLGQVETIKDILNILADQKILDNGFTKLNDIQKIVNRNVVDPNLIKPCDVKFWEVSTYEASRRLLEFQKSQKK